MCRKCLVRPIIKIGQKSEFGRRNHTICCCNRLCNGINDILISPFGEIWDTFNYLCHLQYSLAYLPVDRVPNANHFSSQTAKPKAKCRCLNSVNNNSNMTTRQSNTTQPLDTTRHQKSLGCRNWSRPLLTPPKTNMVEKRSGHFPPQRPTVTLLLAT